MRVVCASRDARSPIYRAVGRRCSFCLRSAAPSASNMRSFRCEPVLHRPLETTGIFGTCPITDPQRRTESGTNSAPDSLPSVAATLCLRIRRGGKIQPANDGSALVRATTLHTTAAGCDCMSLTDTLSETKYARRYRTTLRKHSPFVFTTLRTATLCNSFPYTTLRKMPGVALPLLQLIDSTVDIFGIRSLQLHALSPRICYDAPLALRGSVPSLP
jgi:hypothetical protein